MRSTRLAAGALLFVGALALYSATTAHAFVSPDERRRFDLAEAIARRGLGAIRNSGFISNYPPLTSVYAAPFVQALGKLDRPGDDTWARRGGAAAQAVAVALGVLVFYGLLLRLGYSQQRATLATALFAVANPLWPYAKRFYSEPLTTLLVLTTAWGALRVRSAPAAGAAIMIGSVALLGHNSWTVATVAGFASLASLALERRWKLVAVTAGALALAAGLVLAVTWVRFGRIDWGYGNETFAFHVGPALVGLLVGPGRSIFLFAPTTLLGAYGLWLRYRRGARDLFAFSLIAFGLLFAIILSWWAWYSGMCFGPRLLLPVLPLVSLSMAEVVDRPRWAWASRLIVAWGVYVQLVGVSLVHEYDAYLWMNEGEGPESLAWFSPSHSILLRGPRDVVLSPWDVSSDFLVRLNRDRTTVEADGRPLRWVEVGQNGQSILYTWAVSDVVAIIGGHAERAYELGAHFEGEPPVPGSGPQFAVDADPISRWSANRYRKPGMKVQVDLGRSMAIERLELVHAPHWDDFPSDAWARGSDDGRSWRELKVLPGTPILGMHPAFYGLLGAFALCFLFAFLFAASGQREPVAMAA